MPIRHANNNDAQLINTLAQPFLRFGATYPAVINAMLQANANVLGPYGVTGAVELFVHTTPDGTGNGFVAIEWQPTEGKVHAISVDPAARQAGIARMLLQHVENAALQRNVRMLSGITAETENAPALGCLLGAGYTNLGYIAPYPNGQRAVRLVKTLG
jgi:ribosomal protein S18 acetylase RimI-like enzyme